MENPSTYWIIDTDYSLDDQLILPKLINSFNVVAITVVGNAGVDPSTIAQKIENDISKLSTNKIDVYIGCDRPYINYQEALKDEPIINAYYTEESIAELSSFNKPIEEKVSSEKKTSFKNVAALKIIELVKKYEKSLNILTLGPLTNISLAGQLNYRIHDGYNRLYIAGGSLNNWGNSGNIAEYNIRCDPVAAKNVICYFKNIFLIPLEVYAQFPRLLAIKEVLERESSDPIVKCIQDFNLDKKKYNDFSFFGVIVGIVCMHPEVITVEKELPTDIDIIGRFSRGSLVIPKYEHIKADFCKINIIMEIDADLAASYI